MHTMPVSRQMPCRGVLRAPVLPAPHVLRDVAFDLGDQPGQLVRAKRFKEEPEVEPRQVQVPGNGNGIDGIDGANNQFRTLPFSSAEG